MPQVHLCISECALQYVCMPLCLRAGEEQTGRLKGNMTCAFFERLNAKIPTDTQYVQCVCEYVSHQKIQKKSL